MKQNWLSSKHLFFSKSLSLEVEDNIEDKDSNQNTYLYVVSNYE